MGGGGPLGAKPGQRELLPRTQKVSSTRPCGGGGSHRPAQPLHVMPRAPAWLAHAGGGSEVCPSLAVEDGVWGPARPEHDCRHPAPTRKAEKRDEGRIGSRRRALGGGVGPETCSAPSHRGGQEDGAWQQLGPGVSPCS